MKISGSPVFFTLFGLCLVVGLSYQNSEVFSQGYGYGATNQGSSDPARGLRQNTVLVAEIDPAVTLIFSYDYFYDQQGNQVRLEFVRTTYVNGVVTDERGRIFRSEYDTRRRLVRQTQEFDDVGFDGIPDQVITITNTYGSREDNLLMTVRETDNGNNGIVDQVEANTFSYDRKGNRVAGLSEVDGNNDGVVDQVGSTLSDWDAKGNELSRIIETDLGADGSVDRITSITNTYDKQGKLIQQDRTNTEGSNDNVSTQTFSYDQQGNRIGSVLESDDGNDGSIDRINYISEEFDRWGNSVLEKQETDLGADGSIDSTFTYYRSY